MCFSATASFAVAAGLAGMGTVAVARTKPPSHRLFSLVPLLFAVQQAAEGVVWLTMRSPDSSFHHVAVAAFLMFAVVVWPTWMPLCLVLIERERSRRRVLLGLLVLGSCASSYAAWLLLQAQPVARIENHSLAYDYSRSGSRLVLALYLPVYVLAAVAPFFVSSMARAKLMGTVLVGALVATFIIQRETLTSTWCFFAALFSGIAMLSLTAEQRHARRGDAHFAADANPSVL